MLLRRDRRNLGGEFFGCSRWPDCTESIQSLNREPYEPYVEQFQARPWDGATLPPWSLKLARQRTAMIQRLESVRHTFSAEEWENLICLVVLLSGGGKVALGQQRRRVELIVQERRGR